MSRIIPQRRVHTRRIAPTKTRPLFYDGLDPISLNKLETMVTNATTLQREALGRRSQADNRRDYDDEFGYPKNNWAGEDYRDLIEQEPIAMIANALYPIECWKTSPSIFELEDAETDTEFEAAWDALPNMLSIEPSYYAEEKGSSIWNMFLVADVLSGYSRHGVIFIGLDDGQQDLTQPAVPRKGMKLNFLRPFPGYLARVTQYDSVQNSRRYGWPTQYAITLSDPTEALQDQFNEPYTTQYVHWSRIVHIADTWHMPSASAVFAHPRLKELRNPILDVRKIRGSSAEMYYKGAFGGFHFGTHPSLGADVDVDTDSLRDMYEQYINGLQRAMFSSGIQLDPLAPQVVDPTPQMLAQMQQIAMAMRCPLRKLIGNETGERSTTDDTKTWNSQLTNRHNRYITPKMIIPTIDRLINLGVLPTPKKGYRCQWPDTNSLSDQEQATVLLTRTQAYQAYVTGGVEQIIPAMDYMTKFDGMEEEEAQAIIDAVEEQQQLEAQDNQALADEHGLVPEVDGFKEPTPDPIEVAKAKAGITKNSEEEVIDILDNAQKLEGGRWITFHGHHVYIKDGVAIAGSKYEVDFINERKIDTSDRGAVAAPKEDTVKKKEGTKGDAKDTSKEDHKEKSTSKKEEPKKDDKQSDKNDTSKKEPVKEKESHTSEHKDSASTDKHIDHTAAVAKIEKDGYTYIDKLPYEQKSQISQYTGGGHYYGLNESMRKCPPKFDCLDKRENTMANAVMSAIANAPKFDKPISVARGMHIVREEEHKKFIDALESAHKNNTSFQMPSIVSTSTGEVHSNFKGHIELKIVAKHGLSVKSISNNKSENEILLHPDNKYKVVSISHESGKHTIHMEQE